jgi:hypothetical protein
MFLINFLVPNDSENSFSHHPHPLNKNDKSSRVVANIIRPTATRLRLSFLSFATTALRCPIHRERLRVSFCPWESVPQ